MTRETFEVALERGRRVEIAVATWLKSRGCRILPVYDYSGLADGKAPKLEAFSATESLVTPDLLVARSGRLVWCEVKWKREATPTRLTGELETGLNLRLWNQYRRVRELTGAQVFILFAHETERLITCDEIVALEHLRPRVYAGSRMGRGGMVFWPLRRLHRLTDYADVVTEAA